MATLTDLSQQIAKLTAENEALKAKAAARQTITCKVSAKGAVSVYGMGKWPVTLYAGQWERLLARKEMILEFIETEADSLSVKD